MKNIINWILRRKPRFRIDGEFKGNGSTGYIDTGWNPSKEQYPKIMKNIKNKLK